MNDNQRDNLYAKQQDSVKEFVFDQGVAQVFDNMIKRSVPGYDAIVAMIGCLAQKYVTANSYCYDLGCSLGAVTLVMRQSIEKEGVRIIGVDNSEPMLDQCRTNIKADDSPLPVDLVCADVRDVKIEQASMVVLNFTLQFIEPQQRAAFIQSIYDGLLPGGVLVLSDKITFDSKEELAFQTELHHTFKKMNGYSDLEIAQKRTALENVLIPDTLAVHQERLAKAGFKESSVWFQCFNFASMIAFKQ